MFRKTRRCPSCKGTQYLRTSHIGKAGTWRCVRCGRIDEQGKDIPVNKEIVLAATCKECGENLKVKKEYDPDDRIPYCPFHGEVNLR